MTRKEANKRWRDKNPETIAFINKIAYAKDSATYRKLKINGCAECGYDKCSSALNFHHSNPKDKKFGVTICSFRKYSIEVFTEELTKCILFCCNCHQEIHTKERLEKLKEYIKKV